VCLYDFTIIQGFICDFVDFLKTLESTEGFPGVQRNEYLYQSLSGTGFLCYCCLLAK
jgi:hypothetical protein